MFIIQSIDFIYKVAKYKLECYPKNMRVDENECVIPLFDILDHIVNRLLEYLHLKNSNLNLILHLKWGFDGTLTKNYKMKFANPDSDDSHVLCTSVVPLQLVEKNSKQIIWTNLEPSSPRFCTCFHMQYVKETEEVCRSEKEYIDRQIEALQPIKVGESSVDCKLSCTMIDGKVHIFVRF